jgi:hypothetical protein
VTPPAAPQQQYQLPPSAQPAPPVTLRYEMKPMRSLVRAGAGLFGAFYGAALVVGIAGAVAAGADDVVVGVSSWRTHLLAQMAYNMIPVAGPAIACAQYVAQPQRVYYTTATGQIGSFYKDPGANEGICAGEIVGMLAEIAGLAMITAGSLVKKRTPVYSAHPRPQVMVVPQLRADGVGLTLSVWDF